MDYPTDVAEITSDLLARQRLLSPTFQSSQAPCLGRSASLPVSVMVKLSLTGGQGTFLSWPNSLQSFDQDHNSVHCHCSTCLFLPSLSPSTGFAVLSLPGLWKVEKMLISISSQGKKQSAGSLSLTHARTRARTHTHTVICIFW